MENQSVFLTLKRIKAQTSIERMLLFTLFLERLTDIGVVPSLITVILCDMPCDITI